MDPGSAGFAWHPFLALTRQVTHDADSVRRHRRVGLVPFAASFVEMLQEYLADTKCGHYARAIAIGGLVPLSEQVRGRLVHTCFEADLSTRKVPCASSKSVADLVAVAKQVLTCFRDAALWSVAHSFVPGPSEYHAATCTFRRHDEFSWMVELLALACVVDLVDDSGGGTEPRMEQLPWQAVASVMHGSDWAKVERVASSIGQAIRCVLLLRASCPNVSHVSSWAASALHALYSLPSVLAACLPGDLGKDMVEGAMQVVHFWTSSESRARLRDGQALLALLCPQDLTADVYLSVWVALLTRMDSPLVCMAVPLQWQRACGDAWREFLLGESRVPENVGRTYRVPMVVHSAYCEEAVSMCTCGAEEAGDTCTNVYNSGSCHPFARAVLEFVDRQPLTRPLAQVPVGALGFVGSLWLRGYGVDDARYGRPPSRVQRVLFCVGDSGYIMKRRRPCSHMDDAYECGASEDGDSVTTVSSSCASTVPYLPSRCASTGGSGHGTVRVKGGRACGYRVKGKPRDKLVL